MTTIHIRVTNNILTATVLPIVTANSQNTARIEVDFDSTWNGYNKSAVFYTSKNITPYEVALSNDGICYIPSEVLIEDGHLYIGIKGVNGSNIKTSTILKYRIEVGTPILVISDPTDDMYQQLLNQYVVLSSRFNNLIALDAGSTTGDAELTDIRVSVDGTIYKTAGESVRNQAIKLDEALATNIDYMYEREKTFIPSLVNGFVRYTNGEISNDSMDNFYKRTDYITLPRYCNEILHNFGFGVGGNGGYAFFDISKQFISGGQILEKIISIPNNARYFMITNYDNTFKHEEKKITIRVKNISAGNTNIHKLVTFGDSHVAQGLWQDAVISYFDIESHINLGIGSSCVAENASATKQAFVNNERITAIKNADPDAIIIIGGTNDVHLDTPLGTNSELSKNIESKDKTTFYGAYSYLIETLLTWKPSLKIILCTIPQGHYDIYHNIKYSDISNSIKEIGTYYSLPIADIFGRCGINKINLLTYSNDLIHYNSLGNEKVSTCIIDTLSTGAITLEALRDANEVSY